MGEDRLLKLNLCFTGQAVHPAVKLYLPGGGVGTIYPPSWVPRMLHLPGGGTFFKFTHVWCMD